MYKRFNTNEYNAVTAMAAYDKCKNATNFDNITLNELHAATQAANQLIFVAQMCDDYRVTQFETAQVQKEFNAAYDELVKRVTRYARYEN